MSFVVFATLGSQVQTAFLDLDLLIEHVLACWSVHSVRVLGFDKHCAKVLSPSKRILDKQPVSVRFGELFRESSLLLAQFSHLSLHEVGDIDVLLTIELFDEVLSCVEEVFLA